MIQEIGKFRIELERDESYVENSSDNLVEYDKVYFEQSEYICTTKIGLKVYENNELLSSAIIGSNAGGTGIHKNSQIIEQDRVIVCCSDFLYCLSLPVLTLIWKTKADEATCFQVFKYEDSYIIHGELAISRIDNAGNILWQQADTDMFTTLKGVDDFKITDDYILATVWGHKRVILDFDGNRLK